MWFCLVHDKVGVSEHALGWWPRGLGLVMEDEPTKPLCICILFSHYQVMEPGDAGVGRLPAVKLLIREDEEEEELGDREGEIIDLNDMLLSDEKLFGLGGGR